MGRPCDFGRNVVESNLRIVAQEIELPGATPLRVRGLAFSPTGALALLGRGEATIALFDLASRRRVAEHRLPLAAGEQPDSPLAFAGEAGRFLLANYRDGEREPALWVSDLEEGRCWRVGAAALRLTRAGDGSVWGISGEAAAAFVQPGALFRYRPGAEQVEAHPEAGRVGLFTEAAGQPGCLFVLQPERIVLYDYERRAERTSVPLLAMPLGATLDTRRGIAWHPFGGGSLLGCFVQAGGEIAPIVLADQFKRPDRGFFCLPESGWVAGVSEDGMVCVFDPFSQRVFRVPGPSPASGAVALAPDEDAWYGAGEKLTKYALVAGEAGREATFRQGQAEDGSGDLRLTLTHESMHLMLRLADDPRSWAECMIPETVDPRYEGEPARPPRMNWDRDMSGLRWQRAADGWWELREEHEDVAYLSRLRLAPAGRRLEAEITVFNRGVRDWGSVHLTPCVGLAGDMLDLPHRRTFVAARDGELTPLAPLVAEFPYVAASVRGSHTYPENPLRPAAFRFFDLGLAENVIVVRARHGRHSLVTAFDQVEALSALFVPCVHCEIRTGQVPAGGQVIVRGFVGWVPGDEHAAYAEFHDWRKALDRSTT
jgi:hypothetical protein